MRSVLLVVAAALALFVSAAAAAEDLPSQSRIQVVATTTTAPPTTTTSPPTTTTTAQPVVDVAEVAPPPPTEPQAMFDAAMARLPVGLWDYLSAHGWSIKAQGPVRGFVGFTYRYQRRSEIHIRQTMNFADVLGALGHEVGHMVDFECLSDVDHAKILAARGRDGGTWFPASNEGDDRHWGVGDWAETFALSLTGTWDGLWPSPGVDVAAQLAGQYACG